MYYAHKKSLISVTVAEKDGVLVTQAGNIPVKEGSFIATNESGNPFLVSDEDFYHNYIPVKKVSNIKKKHKSPFEEQYEKQLLEFASVQMNQEEDQSYIKAMKNNLVNY